MWFWSAKISVSEKQKQTDDIYEVLVSERETDGEAKENKYGADNSYHSGKYYSGNDCFFRAVNPKSEECDCEHEYFRKFYFFGVNILFMAEYLDFSGIIH